MEIIDFMPVIMTKDKDWKPKVATEPGAIIHLPKDAILIKPVKRTSKYLGDKI